MRLDHASLLAALAAAGLLACSDPATSAPEAAALGKSGEANAPPVDSSKVPVDTSKTPVDSSTTPVDTSKTPVDTSKTPVDTIKPPPAAPFRVVGQILGVSPKVSAGGSADTLDFEPVVGAKIAIWRNILVDGQARQVLAAETTSGEKGAYRVDALPGGYYIVKAAPPAGSPFGDSWSYLTGVAPEVTVNVYLWRKP